MSEVEVSVNSRVLKRLGELQAEVAAAQQRVQTIQTILAAATVVAIEALDLDPRSYAIDPATGRVYQPNPPQAAGEPNTPALTLVRPERSFDQAPEEPAPAEPKDGQP